MAAPEMPEAAFSAEAGELAEKAARAIEKEPKNFPAHKVILYDLNSELTAYCAKKFFAENEHLYYLGPALSCELPPFSTDILYEKRQNIAAMAGMTLLGWFLGGALSGLLSLVGMGGDILRVAAVFAMFWLSEYLSANPKARKIILAVLGLSGLSRMAASALGGFVGITGIRQAIFGMGRLPNIFKTAWLFLGSFFVFVFMAKKVDGLNIAAFEESLKEQIAERLKLVYFVFSEISAASGVENSGRSACGKSCPLAEEVMSMLDGLPPQKTAHLLQALRLCGFEPHDAGKWLVWDEAEHRDLYEPVGLVKNGDRCLVFSRPLTKDGKTIRGRVQRMDT